MNLNEILSSKDEHENNPRELETDEELEETPEIEPGYCVECGDQKAELHCAACEEDFCSVCSTVIHRVRTSCIRVRLD